MTPRVGFPLGTDEAAAALPVGAVVADQLGICTYRVEVCSQDECPVCPAGEPGLRLRGLRYGTPCEHLVEVDLDLVVEWLPEGGFLDTSPLLG